jgi:hypothetical protein
MCHVCARSDAARAVLPGHEMPMISYSVQPLGVVDQGNLQSHCAEHCIERHCAHVPQRFLTEHLRRVAVRPARDFVQGGIADAKLGQPHAEARDELEIVSGGRDNARRVRGLGRGGQVRGSQAWKHAYFAGEKTCSMVCGALMVRPRRCQANEASWSRLRHHTRSRAPKLERCARRQSLPRRWRSAMRQQPRPRFASLARPQATRPYASSFQSVRRTIDPPFLCLCRPPRGLVLAPRRRPVLECDPDHRARRPALDLGDAPDDLDHFRIDPRGNPLLLGHT